MLYNAFIWFWRRFRPAEGWLSLFLLLAAIVCLTTAITTVEWIPEDDVVPIGGLLGLLLGVVVAKGPLRPFAAWLLILNYGLVIITVYLGRLLPPLSTLFAGNGASVFRRHWTLFFDRIAGWLLSVSEGGSSEETVVFAFGLGLLIWLLAAYAAWSTYRRRRPLLALTLTALALALNGYFSGGQVPAWFTALFIALAVMLAAAMHFANMEQVWMREGVDYSGEIRIELLATAAGVGFVLLAVSLLLPAIRFTALARAFQQSAPVQQAEDTMQRAFAGVRRPRGEVVPGAGSAGVMPRSYLLGNAPELYETVVFTATVQPRHAQTAPHWRGLSYDVYTGRGWALSNERSQSIAAGEPVPDLQGSRVVTQTVFRQAVDPQIRYTLGFPRTFADPVTVYWRGVDDFSRAAAPGSVYTATSTLLSSSPGDLRQAAAPSQAAGVPDAIISRYTNLPENIPARIGDLAREIVAPHENGYDQTRALESFLRQYPYSLEVDPPPSGRDPVDFFLFDLQRGYCDYYASAMVVMARSVGLPARLVVGYLAQQPDARGVQTLYQINAHAWVEIYFAGHGWVEFEPTSAFPSRAQVVEADPLAIDVATPEPPPTPPPIPESNRPFAPWLALILMLLVLAAWFWFLRRPRSSGPTDTLSWAYSRLQHSARRLGQPTPPSQTPDEFRAAFIARVAIWESHPYLGHLLRGIRPAVDRLATRFAVRQYSRHKAADRQIGSRRDWQRLLRRLWLFRYLKKWLGRLD